MQIILENFTKSFGDLTVIKDMNLKINDGEMMALLGPSGCGKSTSLFAICGIHRMDHGRLLFDDEDVTQMPTQQRNIGVVFQSFALYPHMTVFQNIAFPLTVRKEDKKTISNSVGEMAELVHIENLLERRPEQLSGGQQQRVALARALVRKPGALLLDEPLANLDAKLRLEMRSEVRRVQLEMGITAVLVTHDQVEAMSMSDRIAIMKEGEILQVAKPAEMYQKPENDFVAGFLGNPPISILEGKVSEGHVQICGEQFKWSLPDNINKPENGSSIGVGIRPEMYQPDFQCKIKGTISFVETQGRENLYDIRLKDGSLLRSIQSADSSSLAPGTEVDWGVKSEQLLYFDKEGKRL